MSTKSIRVGIVGYGNVGRGAEKAVLSAPDMELRAVFTRRDPKALELADASVPALPVGAAAGMTGEIDVMLLCGGSATDLWEQGPQFAAMFSTVDSFDTHARIPEYMAAVGAAAKNTTAIVSSGWDPGLFSLMRALSGAVLPDGSSYTFWGRGVSQGHSDALRRIPGVRDAIQYTVPIESAVDAVRSGALPQLQPRDKHLRECYVVAEPGTDKAAIEGIVKSMPNYFADYDTTVQFVEEGELAANHSKMPHGGMVVHSGKTGPNGQVMEFSVKLESNPEFTGSILAAYARAAYRLSREGAFGAKTVLEVPLSYLSQESISELIKKLL